MCVLTLEFFWGNFLWNDSCKKTRYQELGGGCTCIFVASDYHPSWLKMLPKILGSFFVLYTSIYKYLFLCFYSDQGNAKPVKPKKVLIFNLKGTDDIFIVNLKTISLKEWQIVWNWKILCLSWTENLIAVSNEERLLESKYFVCTNSLGRHQSFKWCNPSSTTRLFACLSFTFERENLVEICLGHHFIIIIF